MLTSIVKVELYIFDNSYRHQWEDDKAFIVTTLLFWAESCMLVQIESNYKNSYKKSLGIRVERLLSKHQFQDGNKVKSWSKYTTSNSAYPL